MNSAVKDRIEKIDEGIVPEGYKKTKVGIIPGDWEVKKLGEVSEVIMGQSPKSENYNVKKMGLPLIQGNADMKLGYTAPKMYTSEITKVCEIGDIIMSVRAPVGALAISKHKACIGRGVCSIKANKYIYYFLIKNDNKLEKYSQGSTFKAINSSDIRNLQIPTPPLQEQEKIADILSTWDKAIENIEKLIKEKEMQKKGLMQELLTGETRLPGFNGEWKEVNLGEIGKFLTSSVNKKISKNEKDIWLLNYMDVYNNKYIDSNINFMKVTATEHQIKTNNLVKGDILFTPSSETRDDIGHSAVVIEDMKEVLYSYHLMRYRINSINLVDINFRGYCFNNEETLTEFSKLATGSTRYTLSKGDFENVRLNLPPLPEQKAIAEILSTADKEIELLKKLLINKKEEKKGLMQLLLTGIVRVQEA